MISTKIPLLLLTIISLFFSSCSNEDGTESTDSDNVNFVEVTLPNITGYPVVDTNQSKFFGNTSEISTPSVDEDFYGQDAQYSGHQPSYTENGNGTLIDNVTGLMWQSTFDHNADGSIDIDDKLTYSELLDIVDGGASYAGFNDWRLPTIKEQYSLIIFSGRDVSGYEDTSTEGLTPFINTDYFEFAYGDTDAGERIIDVQCASTNTYDGGFEDLIFGVNFADGRIKGYGMQLLGQDKTFNYLLVRGRTDYGVNNFSDNGDGTITDAATNLMWMQDDNGESMIWKDALSYAENTEFASYSDWRLPNAKELQSILDYSRSPDITNSAAIDALFNASQITNEAGQADYPFYWSGTTHANWTEGNEGAWGAYVAFGRGLGNVNGWVDIHGAGAQRSDPKDGDPSEFSEGHGPQGDAVRIYNYIRLVRDIN